MSRQQELVWILCSAAVITIIWMGSTFYHAFITPTITEPLTTLLRPIPDRFDTRIIERIIEREETTPSYDAPTGSAAPDAEASASARELPSQAPAAEKIETTPPEKETP